MKKLLQLILALAVIFWYTFVATSQVQASDSLDDFLDDILAEDDDTDTTDTNTDEDEHNAADKEKILDEVDGDDRKYAEDKTFLAPKNITDTSVDIITTKALYKGKEVDKYRIYYSEKTLTSKELDLINDIIADASKIDDDNKKISLELKGLKANTKYYVVVSPVHPTDTVNQPATMITEEISFTTKPAGTAAPADTKEEEKEDDKTTADPKEEEKNEEPKEEEPKKEEVKTIKPTDTVFTGVKYTNDENKVTLTWNGNNDDIAKAEINLRHQGESSYTKVGSPQYKNGTFTFSVNKAGNYFLKIRALDKTNKHVGKEHIQTVKVTEVMAPTENKEAAVTKAPAVGPTTDLLIALIIFSLMVYTFVRFRRR